MKSIGMIGGGAWGTAIGKILAEKGHQVQIWAYEQELVDSINTRQENNLYLPGVSLPANLTADRDIRAVAQDKDFVIFSTPSLYLLPAVRQIVTVPNIAEGHTPLGVLTKGFVHTQRGPRLILETMEDYLPGFYKGNLVYISGPSHAEEVARGKLTGLISASQNPKNSIRFRELLNSETLMVFSSLDVIGVQISAAVKNVVAIAFGIMDAMKEFSGTVGDNTESLLLAAGLNEIQTIARAMGSTHPETFTSIAGVGDLDVTCRSIHGRNRRFGREIVLKHILEPFSSIDDLLSNLQELGYLPEGAVAVANVKELAERLNLKLPISSGVFRILNKENTPMDEARGILASLTGARLDFHVDFP
ncbi:NAD(P)H-dependent glycerol-3-phosphate dehydrogenase [Spirochaeta lutea]|uniref:Glycerol-3-phosphate dehydrogenase [NAD(P)+] n=1 Tax=Spirochaeta lutea TaxID=1480694 RepID=A0A098QV17_9SPIO|nr:NAD(P)H-dependent glycerol-3-phosphate dehydrogenase [Spirochaeta lutea]KGE71258.1 glycerol-3-phosphate dehydrogenase [Spirochaeta lutea]